MNNGNKMYKKPSNDPLTQCFDEGVHPSWATSPWSSFHGLGLCISSKWKKLLFKIFQCSSKRLQHAQNVQIIYDRLFLSPIRSNFAKFMASSIMAQETPLKLEHLQLTLLILEEMLNFAESTISTAELNSYYLE